MLESERKARLKAEGSLQSMMDEKKRREESEKQLHNVMSTLKELLGPEGMGALNNGAFGTSQAAKALKSRSQNHLPPVGTRGSRTPTPTTPASQSSSLRRIATIQAAAHR
eukprot:TRINITY_DN800_c0_g1_i2.p1 TRINITY_DN800_c0_g1~~TRINITY_DN800_c0_g1_i2.p1  ORF type:complete len:110 (+),score=25.49 TRINITY_DN800_c0_g1_i2:224-553(+)